MHPSDFARGYPIREDEQQYDRLREAAKGHGTSAAMLVPLLPAALALPVFYFLDSAYYAEGALGLAFAIYMGLAAIMFPVVVIALIVQQWRKRRELLVEARAEWARVLKGREPKLVQPTDK